MLAVSHLIDDQNRRCLSCNTLLSTLYSVWVHSMTIIMNSRILQQAHLPRPGSRDISRCGVPPSSLRRHAPAYEGVEGASLIRETSSRSPSSQYPEDVTFSESSTTGRSDQQVRSGTVPPTCTMQIAVITFLSSTSDMRPLPWFNEWVLAHQHSDDGAFVCLRVCTTCGCSFLRHFWFSPQSRSHDIF